MDLPIEDEFKRISNSERISSANIPYTTQYIDLLIKYYEDKEQYERCQVLYSYKINVSSVNTHNSMYECI